MLLLAAFRMFRRIPPKVSHGPHVFVKLFFAHYPNLMQDDFNRDDPVDEANEELPPGMHIVDDDEKADELEDEKNPKEDLDPPLNLNEEYGE